MKSFIILFLFLCISSISKADVFGGDFMILSNGDTVLCQIKIAGKRLYQNPINPNLVKTK